MAMDKNKELKKILEEKLKEVPNNERIYIDKEILEELLFETVVLDEETNMIIKCPNWSGDFLSKIDLSELTFEDVAWSNLEFMRSFLEEEYKYYDDPKYDILFVRLRDAVEKYHNRKLNYSNTNATIDFKKSAEYKIYEEVEIDNVDFSGTNLSNFDINCKYMLSDLKLTNTGFPIKKILKGKNLYSGVNLISIDISNTDLSSIELNGRDMLDISENFELSLGCNLSNTGVKIIYQKYKDQLHKKERECLGEMIKLGLLDGCYVDDHLISSKEELKIKRDKEKVKILKKDKKIEKLFNDIDRQLKY